LSLSHFNHFDAVVGSAFEAIAVLGEATFLELGAVYADYGLAEDALSEQDVGELDAVLSIFVVGQAFSEAEFVKG